MSIRTIVLGALAAFVAVGGIFLLIEVRSSGASAPSDLAGSKTPEKPVKGAAPRIENLNADRGGSAKVVKGSQIERPPTPEIDRALAEKIARDTAGRGAEVETADPAVNPDFDAAMLEANKLYDRHNYEEARTLALKLLERQPGTVRMLRVVVSSSCILGDGETAQRFWGQLPEFDRGQMTTRCERFGVTFQP